MSQFIESTLLLYFVILPGVSSLLASKILKGLTEFEKDCSMFDKVKMMYQLFQGVLLVF
jgi:hypothetical protein